MDWTSDGRAALPPAGEPAFGDNAKAPAFELDEASGLFEGYAALFGVEDLSRDVIAPGAFARSVSEKGTAGIRMLYQHQPTEPIGRWLEICEDARGLFVRGCLLLDIARGREVHTLMRAGALDGLSIGFHAVKGHTDQKSGLRTLYEIDLWEISVVTFPMQAGARVFGAKSGASLLAVIRHAARRLTPFSPTL